MRARLLACLLLALPLLAPAQYKPWYNFYNFSYGAKARSLGNAFTAVADDLTAAFWNPAGLAALRVPEFHLSYKTTRQRHDYDLQDNTDAGGSRLYNFNFDSRLNQIDFFAVSAPAVILKRPCTFTLSYYRYIPYGFKGSAREVLTSLKDRFNPQRYSVNFTGSEGLDVLAFSASAAVSGHFAIGVTLQQFFGSGGLHLAMVEPDDEYHRQFSEKLQGRNVIIGALFTPVDFLRLGFTWHSGLKSGLTSGLLTWDVDPEGEEINPEEFNCEARVALPEHYSLGVLLRPARWLDLSADYSRLDWDGGTIENYFDIAGTAPFPQKDAWETGQKQARNLRFGVEARLPFRAWKLSLRGGWSLDSQLYADTSGEAVKVRGYAAGVGCEFTSNLRVEVTYQRQVADWPEASYFFQGPDVGTHFRANVFFLALTYRFGHIFKE
jgi:long-subunit fatty acid transport protein